MTSDNTRILSIDIMRGLTLFLMLFVNDLFVPGVPKWLVHTAANEDGMGLADWVFPGFLFMVGLSIPFAFIARQSKGESKAKLLYHIGIRTISLLVIGIFMVNLGTFNNELASIDKYLWGILVYLCIFLIWNNYSKLKYKKLQRLRFIGILGLIILSALYRSGTLDEPTWMSTSWWGILGLIGWGYLVSAITYLYLKDRVIAISVVWLFFLILNILAQTSLLDFLNPIKPIFGVILNGNVPSIVLSGLLVGTILKKHKHDHKMFFSYIIPLGLACIVLGFVLRNWFIISKIMGTPSWAMLCNGISILVFSLLYFLLDVKKWTFWSKPFLPAGQNSLTTYLAPNILYFIIWSLGSNILLYKQADLTWLAIIGSVVWAFAMIWLASLLSKMNISLKL